MSFDGTGCFHWVMGRTAEECTLTRWLLLLLEQPGGGPFPRQEAMVTMFAGHIVVGVFADEDSPMIGLRNFVMPLRCCTST